MKLVVKKLMKEGKVEEAIELYRELVECSRKEEGCISYNLFQDDKNHRILAVIEEWESQEALDKHTKSQHFTRLVPIIGELMEKSLDMSIYNKVID